jgi:hypothetical protein
MALIRLSRRGFARLAAWLRLVRRLGLGRNPLRRRTDRLEAGIMAALLGIFLVGAPMSAILLARATQAGIHRELQVQRSWHHAPAVVLRSAPSAPRSGPQADRALAWVPAMWTVTGGRQRTGEVQVLAGTRAGTTIRIWVDAAGHLTSPPWPRSQLEGMVTGTEVVLPITIAILLLAVARLVHWLMDRRRLAEWEREWASAGPGWPSWR